MKKIVIGIQSRLSSTRLPAKALLKLSNTTIIGMTILRAKAYSFPTYLLTSNRKEDNILCKEAKGLTNGIIRGSLENVLQRYLILSQKTNADYIVRVTGDNPLTEYNFIKPLITKMEAHNLNYCWVDPYLCADGINLEIFTPKFLKISFESDKSNKNIEHVTSWMQENSPKESYSDPKEVLRSFPINSPKYHFGIDTFEDFIKVENIITSTESKVSSWTDKNFVSLCIKNALSPNYEYPLGRRHFP